MHNLGRERAVLRRRREFEDQARTFLPALYGAARRLISGPAEAVVTEVYCRAYHAGQEHTDTGRLKRWLFVLLWQVCLDTWRRQHTHGIPTARPSFSPLQVSVTSLQGAAVDPASDEGRIIVRQALESLPIALRLVVLLVDLERFSYHDTAAIVRCPVALVASRLHRARQRLAGQLCHL